MPNPRDFPIDRRQQQFFVFLGAVLILRRFCATTAHQPPRLANPILLIVKVRWNERPAVTKSFGFAPAGLALPAPADDMLAGHAQTFKKYIAVLVRKIKLTCLLRCVRPKIHVPSVIQIEKLESF